MKISKVLSDCWDCVAPPDNMNDIQFFDSFFAKPSAKPVEDILLRLGQHLLKEDFTSQIEEVFAHKSAESESKRQVIQCLREKFERFFETMENMTLERFDKDLLAHDPQLAQEKPSPLLKSRLSGNELTLSLPRPGPIENIFRPLFRVIPGSILDFTGHWRRPPSSLDSLEKMRSVIGFSWIERKWMLQMESEFFIWYEGNTMFVRSQRKLAGSNTLIHVIDGVDYPFVQPSAIMGDNAPSMGMFNRTWATDDGFMHFVQRIPWNIEHCDILDALLAENRLESELILQKNDSGVFPGVWTDVYSYQTWADRVLGIVNEKIFVDFFLFSVIV